jgi:F0F1-type ATP synthase assembly protein I
MYGLLGWLVDQWWGTSFMVVVGILAGAGLGIYMTFARFNRPWASKDSKPPQAR